MIERVQMLTVAPVHDREMHDSDSPRVIAGGREVFSSRQHEGSASVALDIYRLDSRWPVDGYSIIKLYQSVALERRGTAYYLYPTSTSPQN